MNLPLRSWLPLAALLGWTAPPPALAQSRCDCTRTLDSCKAGIAVRGRAVEISSDHKQCSRVDYLIGGQPFVSVAVDGRAQAELPSGAGAPDLVVQSCQVCADSAFEASTQSPSKPVPATADAEARSPGAAAQGGELRALIQVQPLYPAAALARGAAGYVELKYTVNAEGRVQSAKVTKSEPGAVFDAPALAAIGRWRYPAEPGRAPVQLTHRFEFTPPSGARLAAAGSPGAPPALAPAGTGSVRNECVHEGPVFDYGQLVQVELQSSCAEPLMVFSCAFGTGRYQGRWTCTDSERQQHVLVRTGDARIGGLVSVSTPDGTRSLTYTDQFIVSRAPNSEYWWLACGAADEACRGAARLWTRSVEGQVASVDPRGRTALEIARSH